LLVSALVTGNVGAAESISARLDGSRLSLTARGSPLVDVLADVARVARISVPVRELRASSVGARATTIEFHAVELEDALRRLLQGVDFIFVYAGRRLQEVRIYLPDERGARGPLRFPGADTGKAVDREALRSTALGDPDARRRQKALSALEGEADDRYAEQTALEVMRQERDPEVLGTALDVLDTAESVPIEDVLPLARGDRNPDLRVRTLEFLVEHAPRDGRVANLLRTAMTDQDEDVRIAATRLLDRLADRRQR
jgi:hypothetical protein